MFSFVTNRALTSRAGRAEAGRVRAFVKVGGSMLEGDLTCPECGKQSKLSQPYKRPLVFRCHVCGASTGLPRLKDEAKRERKQAEAGK